MSITIFRQEVPYITSERLAEEFERYLEIHKWGYENPNGDSLTDSRRVIREAALSFCSRANHLICEIKDVILSGIVFTVDNKYHFQFVSQGDSITTTHTPALYIADITNGYCSINCLFKRTFWDSNEMYEAAVDMLRKLGYKPQEEKEGAKARE